MRTRALAARVTAQCRCAAGFLFTYVAPLVFVLAVTMLKEAYDDVNRYLRDKELNNTSYLRLTRERGYEPTPAAALRVGDIVQLASKQRVPADMVLLRTAAANGSSFIKTDQLELNRERVRDDDKCNDMR